MSCKPLVSWLDEVVPASLLCHLPDNAYKLMEWTARQEPQMKYDKGTEMIMKMMRHQAARVLAKAAHKWHNTGTVSLQCMDPDRAAATVDALRNCISSDALAGLLQQ